MRYAIVNINIQIPVPEGKNAEEVAENYELPGEYVSGSYEFVKEVTE